MNICLLNIINLLFTALEAEKSQIKTLTDLVSGKGLLPGSEMAVFFLKLHMAKRAKGGFLGFVYRDIKPTHEGPSSCLSNF
jgi:hypothetical protein